MKLSRILALAALFALPIAASADVSPISIRVEQKNTTSAEKFEKTQSRALKVFLTNGSKETIAGVKVKYSYFVRTVKGNDVRLLDDGEETADAKGLSVTLVETDAATATSSSKHSSTSTSKTTGRVTTSKKATEATGEKFVGYGVQVFDSAGKLLAEQYDPPSLKQQVAK